MASGNIIYRTRMATVLMDKTVKLIPTQTNANQIDFRNDIELNRPGNYTFDHLEYLGAWPASTFTDAIVARANDNASGILYLTTLKEQNYTIRALAWYRSNEGGSYG